MYRASPIERLETSKSLLYLERFLLLNKYKERNSVMSAYGLLSDLNVILYIAPFLGYLFACLHTHRVMSLSNLPFGSIATKRLMNKLNHISLFSKKHIARLISD